jgi:2-polyprenyl-3-methyl-5-hydroxy-6-metoxy-1,4-benzoquinol methylase
MGRRLERVLSITDRFGPSPALSQQVDEAGRYWGDTSSPSWSNNSHRRDGVGDEAFVELGRDHLAMFRRFAKALDRPPSPGAVIEWGCGGGAIAAGFAPVADSFVGTDLSEENLTECRRQVAAVCDTPVETLLVDVAHPEKAVEGRDNSFDTFICLYVFEVMAAPEEVFRLLRIAERILVPGGMAFVQFKYQKAGWQPPRVKRNYHRNLSVRSTFAIEDFWVKAGDCGLTPQMMTLVPQNRFDERYAYVALTKP